MKMLELVRFFQLVWRIVLLLILSSLIGLIRCGLLLVVDMGPFNSLPILLLFIRSSFSDSMTSLCVLGLLQSSFVLTVHYSTASMPLASPPIAPPLLVVSVGLHFDYCDHDGHVEAFCFEKRKPQEAQTHRSLQSTCDTSFG
jgi:hypothetical protein